MKPRRLSADEIVHIEFRGAEIAADFAGASGTAHTTLVCFAKVPQFFGSRADRLALWTGPNTQISGGVAQL